MKEELKKQAHFKILQRRYFLQNCLEVLDLNYEIAIFILLWIPFHVIFQEKIDEVTDVMMR